MKITTPILKNIKNHSIHGDKKIISRIPFNQIPYPLDKEIMKEYPSPDELDSLGYAFMEIQNVIRL